MELLWNEYLYRPLLNTLIYLYNNYTAFNMGLAVVYVTILLRIILLPLTILSEKSKTFFEELTEYIKEIQKDYPNDQVKQKEEVKKYLRGKRFFPWAKFISLSIQLLVLVLLYQVFLGGINAQEKFDLLYTFVGRPDFIKTRFLWFDISQRDFFINLIVVAILFLEISWVQKKKGQLLTNRDVAFRIIFPVITLLILYSLPSVKSVFILTSILFSFIILSVQFLVWKLVKHKKKPPSNDKVEMKEEQEPPLYEQNPWDRLKKPKT